MSEILSQDQINSLLGQQASAGAVPGGDENDIVGDKAADPGGGGSG